MYLPQATTTFVIIPFLSFGGVSVLRPGMKMLCVCRPIKFPRSVTMIRWITYINKPERTFLEHLRQAFEGAVVGGEGEGLQLSLVVVETYSNVGKMLEVAPRAGCHHDAGWVSCGSRWE